MRKLTQQELNKILYLHREWASSESRGARADLSGYDLRGLNLSMANLYRVDLSLADLSGVNMSGADLSWADLSGTALGRTNLSGADLSRANLSGAIMIGTNLMDADLRDTIGNKLNVKTISLEQYTITYTANILQIWRNRHTFAEWASFDDAAISEKYLLSLKWWKKWKDTIFKLIEMSPAEPTGAEDKS